MNVKSLPSSNKPVEDLLPFSKIKMIVADLDGTLLTHETKTPKSRKTKQQLILESKKSWDKRNEIQEEMIQGKEDIWKLILKRKRSVRNYGVQLTIATGRTFFGVRNLIRNLEIPRGLPLILYNGSVVIDTVKMETILHKKMLPSILDKIMQVVDKKNTRLLAYYYVPHPMKGDNEIDIALERETVLGWSGFGMPTYEFNGMRVKWQIRDSVYPPNAPSAILIDFRSESERLKLLEQLDNEINGVSLTKSGSNFLEVRPEGSDKGSALSEIIHLFNFHKEEILAIGDNDNDAEMLKWAGIGVSVHGASIKAIENSDYVSGYDSGMGTAKVLWLVREARRYYRFKEKRK